MNKISNRDLIKFDEKYIKMMFIVYASLSKLYIFKSESEVEREYPDLMFLYRKPYRQNYQFLIELKYIKISESEKLESKMEEAKLQVKKYMEKEEIRNLENLKSYAVVFVGTKGHFVEL